MFPETKSQLPKYHLHIDKSNCKQNRRSPVILKPANDGGGPITNAVSEREFCTFYHLANEFSNHFLHSCIRGK